MTLTVRRSLGLPDERATMKVHAAAFLLHDEGIEEYRLGRGTLVVGGATRDVLHHSGAASSTEASAELTQPRCHLGDNR